MHFQPGAADAAGQEATPGAVLSWPSAMVLVSLLTASVSVCPCGSLPYLLLWVLGPCHRRRPFSPPGKIQVAAPSPGLLQPARSHPSILIGLGRASLPLRWAFFPSLWPVPSRPGAQHAFHTQEASVGIWRMNGHTHVSSWPGVGPPRWLGPPASWTRPLWTGCCVTAGECRQATAPSSCRDRSTSERETPFRASPPLWSVTQTHRHRAAPKVQAPVSRAGPFLIKSLFMGTGVICPVAVLLPFLPSHLKSLATCSPSVSQIHQLLSPRCLSTGCWAGVFSSQHRKLSRTHTWSDLLCLSP